MIYFNTKQIYHFQIRSIMKNIQSLNEMNAHVKACIENKTLSPKSARDLRCLDCSCYDKKEALHCDHDSCPLHKSKKISLKNIKAYCLECSAGDKQELKECIVRLCPLYSFRLGKNTIVSKAASAENNITPLHENKPPYTKI